MSDHIDYPARTGAEASSFYRPSGRFNPVNLVTALAVGAVAAVVLGALEGVLVRYSPLLILSVLVPIGLGLALGYMSLMLLRWSRVRNRWIPILFALLMAGVALYAAWAAWLALIIPVEGHELSAMELVWRLALNPAAMWHLAVAVSEVGVWSIGRSGDPVRGAFLMLFWLAEAALVAGIAVSIARSRLLARPFCEDCLQWTRPHPAAAKLADGDSPLLAARLGNHDLQALEELGPADLAQARRHRVDLYRCPTCREFNTLCVYHTTLTVNKDGKIEENRRPVIEHLLLDAGEADWVEETGRRLGVVDSEDEARESTDAQDLSTESGAGAPQPLAPKPLTTTPAVDQPAPASPSRKV